MGVFFTSVAIQLAVLVQPALTTSVNLVFQRQGASNNITLTCRMAGTSTTITDARFLLNGTQFNRGLVQDGVLAFIVTREIEGNYFCVNGGNQSRPLAIVGECRGW